MKRGAQHFFEEQARWDESHTQLIVELHGEMGSAALAQLAQDLDDPDAIAAWKTNMSDELADYEVDGDTAHAWWRRTYMDLSKARYRRIMAVSPRANPAASNAYLDMIQAAIKWAHGGGDWRSSRVARYIPRTSPNRMADLRFVIDLINTEAGQNIPEREFKSYYLPQVEKLMDENSIPRNYRTNPSLNEDKDAAVEKYKEFHRYAPKAIGEFHKDFKIPTRVARAGDAKWVTYRSSKVDPATLQKPKRPVNYIHEHDAGVAVYHLDGRDVAVPKSFADAQALTLLGVSLGYNYIDTNGDEIEAVCEDPMPELYATPDGKCLLVVQSKRTVLAMMWGGALGVFARGIDG